MNNRFLYTLESQIHCQISSFTRVGVRYLQFAGGGYFSPLSFTESCDSSPVRILSTRVAIFHSMSGDFLLVDNKA